MSEKKEFNFKKTAVGLTLYISGSVLGPIILFGSVGMLIDKFWGTKPKGVIAFLIIAFAFTNFMLIRKYQELKRIFDTQEK